MKQTQTEKASLNTQERHTQRHTNTQRITQTHTQTQTHRQTQRHTDVFYESIPGFLLNLSCNHPLREHKYFRKPSPKRISHPRNTTSTEIRTDALRSVSISSVWSSFFLLLLISVLDLMRVCACGVCMRGFDWWIVWGRVVYQLCMFCGFTFE